jgi:uncharacterized membrane protein YphA (DoxX/SURF4 family)
MKPALIKNHALQLFMTLLRILIGWQFLYEGVIKIANPAWTARPFLENSRWIFGDLFRWMISGNTGMWIVDMLNAYGLTLIGIALILGVFTRLAAWGGVALLAMYYVAYPPFGGFSYGAPSEGAYLIVNKNMIELLALLIIALTRAGRYYGIDGLIRNRKGVVVDKAETDVTETSSNSTEEVPNKRRELLKGLAGIPVLAVFSGALAKNMAELGPDAMSGATIKVDFKQKNDLKGELPKGKLGNLPVSRMVMGCNLIGGWSHARDLIYSDKLFRAYNSEKKIIDTFALAEQAGIDTCFMVTQYYATFNKFRSIYNSKMQSICQAMLPDKDFYSNINMAIDAGATAIYIQGGEGDRYCSAGKLDDINKAIEYIRKQGFMAGMGAHSIESIKAVESAGIPADFYVKTLHHDKYWSAHPLENRVEYSVIGQGSADHNQIHENMWDLFPQKTIEYMKGISKPWFAFKVLAAGAIEPKDGFRFAFENGADFIAVGMFDFQVIDNVNTACQVLSSLGTRERGWHS